MTRFLGIIYYPHSSAVGAKLRTLGYDHRSESFAQAYRTRLRTMIDRFARSCRIVHEYALAFACWTENACPGWCSSLGVNRCRWWWRRRFAVDPLAKRFLPADVNQHADDHNETHGLWLFVICFSDLWPRPHPFAVFASIVAATVESAAGVTVAGVGELFFDFACVVTGIERRKQSAVAIERAFMARFFDRAYLNRWRRLPATSNLGLNLTQLLLDLAVSEHCGQMQSCYFHLATVVQKNNDPRTVRMDRGMIRRWHHIFSAIARSNREGLKRSGVQ